MEPLDEVDVRLLAVAGPVGLAVRVLHAALAAAVGALRRRPTG
jgi:hypothetical protein